MVIFIIKLSFIGLIQSTRRLLFMQIALDINWIEFRYRVAFDAPLTCQLSIFMRVLIDKFTFNHYGKFSSHPIQLSFENFPFSQTVCSTIQQAIS